MRVVRYPFLLLLAFVLSACNPQAAPRPTAAQPGSPTATTLPVITTPATIPTIPSSSTVSTLPAPEVIPIPWADRSVFKSGLISSEQSILDGLPGASVYHIDLTIHPDLVSLSGQEEILYTNRENTPLDRVYLRLFPNLMAGKLTVSDLKINGDLAASSLEQHNSALNIPLASPLAPGDSLVIRLAFEEQVPSGNTTGYGILGLANNVLSLSQAYPLIPVYDDRGWHTEIPPSYGDPAYTDTAFYLVRVTAPQGLVIAGSGKTINQTTSGDTQTFQWAAGPARDFYIAASSQFRSSSAIVGETTITSYISATENASGEQVLQVAGRAFDSYGKRFGPYPYTYFNITATATQALGIEYPGEIALNQQLLDPNGQFGSIPTRIYLEATVAHEAAHQWFYGVVGDDQVNQPWLDESMAQYDTYLYYQDVDGQTAADRYKSDWEARWARVGNEKIPIGEPVSSYSEQSYSAIVYGRGPLFLDALSQQMGETKFDAFLKDYYQTNKWGIATTSGFETLAQKDCGCNLTQLFTDWIGNP